MIHRKAPVPESFFNKKTPEACNFIKKETLARMTSCEFCETFKNTFFTELLWATATKILKSIASLQ